MLPCDLETPNSKSTWLESDILGCPWILYPFVHLSYCGLFSIEKHVRVRGASPSFSPLMFSLLLTEVFHCFILRLLIYYMLFPWEYDVLRHKWTICFWQFFCLYISVPEPQLDTFVLCRSKEYLTGIQLEDGPVDDRQFSCSWMN